MAPRAYDVLPSVDDLDEDVTGTHAPDDDGAVGDSGSHRQVNIRPVAAVGGGGEGAPPKGHVRGGAEMIDHEQDAPMNPPGHGEVTPLPRKQMACVLILQISEACQINVLFPFVAFMVEDFGFTGRSLGLHTGMLASSFCAAQFCSSVPWGMLSDRIGRKRCLVLGTLGSSFTYFIFGTARSFPQAMFARILAGLLNGNIGIMKSFLGQITDDTNRSAGFSYLAIAWGVGVSIAPVMGGMLSSPADTWSVFEGTVFDRNPYLLPCMVVACYGITASLLTSILMEDLRDQKSGSGASPVVNGKSLSTAKQTEARYIAVQVSDDDAEAAEGQVVPAATRGGVGHVELCARSFSEVAKASRAKAGDESEEGECIDDIDYSTPSPVKAEEAARGVDAACDSRREPCFVPVSKADDSATATSVLWERTVLIACSCYGMLAVMQQMVDEAMPLFMKLSNSRGGIGFAEKQIGMVLATSGIATLVVAVYIVPPVERRIGALAIYRRGLLGCLPLFSSLWVIGILWQFVPHWVGWAFLIAAVCLKNTFFSFSFCGSMVMISNSVAPEHLGSVNGLGQTFAAFARATGPTLCGGVWSVATALHFVPLTFLVIGAVCGCALLVSLNLPGSLRYSYGKGGGVLS